MEPMQLETVALQSAGSDHLKSKIITLKNDVLVEWICYWFDMFGDSKSCTRIPLLLFKSYFVIA